MVRVDSRIYLAVLVGIVVMGIAYKPLILLILPALVYGGFREWLVESLLSLATQAWRPNSFWAVTTSMT